jgi:ADP-heptose:LPS heptosyltransferase
MIDDPVAPSVWVIRPGALGDTILTLPLLETIRKAHASARIVFVGTATYGCLLPAGTEFRAFESPQMLWLMREPGGPDQRSPEHIDTAYVLLNNADPVSANLWSAGCTDTHVSATRPPAATHIVRHFHESLGLSVPERKPALTHLIQKAEQDLIWMHPGSGGASKCAPVSVFYDLADHVSRVTGLPIVVTQGKADSFLSDDPDWPRLLAVPNTQLLTGKSIPDICCGLSAASLYVGNDSGISHLAAGLGIPSIVLFRSTDPAQWAPWAPEDQVRIVDVRSSSDINVVRTVTELISTLIGRA